MILIERSQPILTLREIGMVRVMERITDMPDWHKKVGLLISDLAASRPACYHAKPQFGPCL
jgi:hypothetical protein